MADLELIHQINTSLETIAILNSFTNDGKTYYIALLDKVENDISQTLREHFDVKSWTFDLTNSSTEWNVVLKDELLLYFGQYLIQAKQPYVESVYAGNQNIDHNDISKRIIRESGTNCEFLLNLFLENIKKLISSRFTFYKLKVNWDTPNGYETWYEAYENDYLFDLGNQILFLHFGSSD